MSKRKEAAKVFRAGRCEICDGEVEYDEDIERGDVVSCIECGAEYTVRALQPVRLLLISEGNEEDDEE